MMPKKKRASTWLRTRLIPAAIVGTMALLLLVEARLTLPAALSKLMQLAIVVLVYGLLAIWINADPGAML
ncbi:MAG: hypothetical protein JXM73_07855 [Anaerolineae bacterium]|nr:hypothetical protein [Anaerolineae bacterium]